MSRTYNAFDSATAHQPVLQTSLLSRNNEKLDTQNTTLSGIKTNQEGTIGSINNADIGSGGNFRRSAVYAYDSINDQARSLRCDANGRLECSVDALEVSADTINLNTDNLETLTTATNTKLDTSNTNLTNIHTDTTSISLKVSGLKNSQSQNGLGGGDANGVMINDIRSNTSLTSSTLASVSSNTGNIDTKLGTTNTLLNAGLPSALSSDQLKVEDAGTQFSLGLIGSAQGTTNTLLTSLDSKANTRDGHLNNIVNQTSGLASESTLGDIDTKLDDRLPPALTTGGNLKVAIEEGGSTATLSEQQAQTALLTTMDTDTGNIASNTSLTNSTLASIDSKITTGADLTLSSAQQNLVYGVDAFNTSVLEPIRISSDKVMAETFIASVASGITNELPISNAKITTGSDSTLTQAQQVLIYGKNGTGDLKPIHITNNGDVEVEIADFVKGQTTASASFPTTDARNKVKDVSWMTTESISSNTRSTSTLDSEGYGCIMIYGEATSGTPSNNVLKIQGSNSATGIFYHVAGLALQTYDGSRYLLKEDSPLTQGNHPRYLKIYNSDTSSVTLTLRAVMSNLNEYQ